MTGPAISSTVLGKQHKPCFSTAVCEDFDPFIGLWKTSHVHRNIINEVNKNQIRSCWLVPGASKQGSVWETQLNSDLHLRRPSVKVLNTAQEGQEPPQKRGCWE